MNYPVTAFFLAFALLAGVPPTSAETIDANDAKCDLSVARAWDKYSHCTARTRDSSDLAPCLERLAQAWPKLQTFSDSFCDAATRWVDNGDGTVTDHLTGLIWEKKESRDGVVNAANPHDADNRYTLQQEGSDAAENGTVFTEFLAALNSGGGFAGSNGWRVPTVKELFSIFLVNGGVACSALPCLDPVFGDVPTSEDEGIFCTLTHPLSNPWGQSCVEETSRSMVGVGSAMPNHYRAVRSGNTVW